MKRTISLIFAVSLFLTGYSKSKVLITGQIADTSSLEVVYSVPLNGTCFFRDTLQADNTGNFQLKLDIVQPAFVQLRTANSQKQVRLLIEPNEKYHVILSKENKAEISGSNAKGQLWYNSLPAPDFIEEEGKSFRNDTSLAIIQEKIAQLKHSDLENLQQLLEEQAISSTFFQLAKNDRDCYYASLEARTLLIKFYNYIPRTADEALSESGKELLKRLGDIYARYSPNDKALLASPFWGEYAEYYLGDYLLLGQLTQENGFQQLKEIAQLYQNGQGNTLVFAESKKHLTGAVREFFQAKTLLYVGSQMNYEKELIPLFAQFQKDYPKSAYTPYLQPEMDAVTRYHQVIENPFDATIQFVDNYAEINTLEEAIRTVKGKKIYIDIWATWCGPCKKEFAYNKALSKLLAEKDIQQLYISIDKPNAEEKWKENIKFYHLEGSHILANQSLETDLRKRYDKKKGETIAIPWYILVDENGTIIEEHAKSPAKLVARDYP